MMATMQWLWIALAGLGGCCIGVGFMLVVILILVVRSVRRTPPPSWPQGPVE